MYTFTQSQPRRYGWKPGLPDARNHMFAVNPQLAAALPPKFSLRPKLPNPYDQSQLGSCTANTLARLVANELILNKRLTLQASNTPAGTPSRLMIYYLERSLEGTINQDAGAEIKDGIKALAKWGTCFENTWPYNIAQFTTKPSTMAYKLALNDVIKSYATIPVNNVLGQKLAISQNHPVGFGFSVYESFESDQVAQTGLMPVPDITKEQMLGGHAVVRIGWDDTKVLPAPGGKTVVGAFEVANSWGISWGDHGHFWMPYVIANDPNYCSDAWIIAG